MKEDRSSWHCKQCAKRRIFRTTTYVLFVTDSFNTNFPLSWFLNQSARLLKKSNKIRLSRSYSICSILLMQNLVKINFGSLQDFYKGYTWDILVKTKPIQFWVRSWNDLKQNLAKIFLKTLASSYLRSSGKPVKFPIRFSRKVLF